MTRSWPAQQMVRTVLSLRKPDMPLRISGWAAQGPDLLRHDARCRFPAVFSFYPSQQTTRVPDGFNEPDTLGLPDGAQTSVGGEPTDTILIETGEV